MVIVGDSNHHRPLIRHGRFPISHHMDCHRQVSLVHIAVLLPFPKKRDVFDVDGHFFSQRSDVDILDAVLLAGVLQVVFPCTDDCHFCIGA